MSEILFANQGWLDKVKENVKAGQIEAARLYAAAVVAGLPESSENNETLLDTRIIGTFSPDVSQRSPRLRDIIHAQGLLQDLLTDRTYSPSTTFDPRKGLVSITVRRSLLNPKNYITTP